MKTVKRWNGHNSKTFFTTIQTKKSLNSLNCKTKCRFSFHKLSSVLNSSMWSLKYGQDHMVILSSLWISFIWSIRVTSIRFRECIWTRFCHKYLWSRTKSPSLLIILTVYIKFSKKSMRYWIKLLMYTNWAKTARLIVPNKTRKLLWKYLIVKLQTNLIISSRYSQNPDQKSLSYFTGQVIVIFLWLSFTADVIIYPILCFLWKPNIIKLLVDIRPCLGTQRRNIGLLINLWRLSFFH